MKTNKELYALAHRYLGSDGSAAKLYCGLSKGASWCDAYVTFIFYKGGCKELFCKGTKQTYCPTTIEICRKLYAEIPLYLAMPMDVIFFDWEPNGLPNHIGFVKEKINTAKIRTHEGNTSGGKVDEKTRPKKYDQAVFRIPFPAKFNISKPLKIDSDFGYNSIAMLQKVLKKHKYYTGAIDGILGKVTLKAFQKLIGATPDGAWRAGTTRKAQKFLKIKQDGACGPATVKKLQEYCNKQIFKTEPIKVDPPKDPVEDVKAPKPKKKNAQKIVDEIYKLAWKKGTPKKYWSYKKGRPRNAMKKAMKDYGYDTKAELSDCGNNVNTVVRKSGVDKHFTSLHAVKTPFPKHEDKFKIVISGRVPKVKEMKAGDIIRYKKKGGKDQHAMFYLGHNLIADAGHYNRFFNIRKNDFRYKRRNVKKSTIQVLRAKE